MIPYSGPIVTREAARAAGLKRFFTGDPCRSGHSSQRGTSDGKCLHCIRERQRRWTATNKCRLSAYKKQWRADNPDALKRWVAENPDKARKHRKTEYARHSDKIKERRTRHAKENPGMVLAWSRNKRARKRLAGGSHTSADIASIRKLQRDHCAEPSCRIKLHGKGHVDHIVPLFRGGSNDRRNLQILCAPCNMRKRYKDPLDFARENGRFL